MTDRLIYPYVERMEYVPDGVARPFLPVTIRYGQSVIQTWALLDSGSDINVLPYQLGVELGARWDSRGTNQELQGIGGGIEARTLDADLYVDGWPTVGQTFAWARDDDVPVILGQFNFFQKVNVCFHGSRNVFELDLNPQ